MHAGSGRLRERGGAVVMSYVLAGEVLGASTHVSSPLESKIFGTLFVVLCVVIVLGYFGFEFYLRREARRREQRHFLPTESDDGIWSA